MVTFQELRGHVDLVALVQQRVPLKRQGVRWIGRCPFHDDHHPSLDVSPVYHTWRCWSCGATGDAVDWVRLTENCSVREAVQRLTHHAGLGTSESVDRPRLLEADALASREARHAVYTALLTTAGLSAAHRQALRQRGLSEAAIDQGQYATLPPGDRQDLLAVLRDTFPDLRGIPGIARRPDRPGWRLEGSPGLLIPVRDRRGQIQACQIRRDTSQARYHWLTSTPHRAGWTGTSPGTPFHVAGTAWRRPRTLWWVTEGPLKADVAAFFLHRPVLGIPGVSLWPRVGQVLSQWHPPAVVLAFDHDPHPETRARVQAAQQQLGVLLQAAGIRVLLATWPEGPKGVDDALAQGLTVQPTAWMPSDTAAPPQTSGRAPSCG